MRQIYKFSKKCPFQFFLSFFLGGGVSGNAYVVKGGGEAENLFLPMRGGGGVKKSENLAYVVYGWSLRSYHHALK